MKINKKTSTPEEVSEKMVKFAHDYVTKMSNLRFSSYADSMRIYYSDASDYCKIAALIADHDFKGAVRVAYKMDTCPRDEIPQDVWDFITYQSRA